MCNMQISFRGIDSWGRPVFKQIGQEAFFGDTDHLFRNDVTESQILSFYSGKNLSECLVYFGRVFGCEPEGDPIHSQIKLIREG